MFQEFFSKLKSDCFDRYPKEIERQNRDTVGRLIVVVMFVSLLNFLADLLAGQLAIAYQPLVLITVFAAFDVFYHFRLRKSMVSARLILYLMLTVALFASVIIGTFLAPTKGVFTFAVLLPVAAIFVLDRPHNIVLWISSICIIFAVCCYIAKPADVFMRDLSHLFIFGPLALGSGLFVIEVRIANVEQAMELRRKSDHDALTGVYNRGGGDERIGRLVGAGTRGLLVFIDVDDFKKINDTYGHDGGDKALRALSGAITASFRATDIVMRAGGDEFIVFAPGLVDFDDVRKCIDRLRERVGALEFPMMPGCRLTVSLGCVVNDGSYPDYARLRDHADSLMYEVKLGGKNSYLVDSASYEASSEPQLADSATLPTGLASSRDES